MKNNTDSTSKYIRANHLISPTNTTPFIFIHNGRVLIPLSNETERIKTFPRSNCTRFPEGRGEPLKIPSALVKIGRGPHACRSHFRCTSNQTFRPVSYKFKSKSRRRRNFQSRLNLLETLSVPAPSPSLFFRVFFLLLCSLQAWFPFIRAEVSGFNRSENALLTELRRRRRRRERDTSTRSVNPSSRYFRSTRVG